MAKENKVGDQNEIRRAVKARQKRGGGKSLPKEGFNFVAVKQDNRQQHLQKMLKQRRQEVCRKCAAVLLAHRDNRPFLADMSPRDIVDFCSMYEPSLRQQIDRIDGDLKESIIDQFSHLRQNISA